MNGVLVTGARGRVGRHVVAQLAAAGVEARSLVRDPAAAGHVGDLRDPESLVEALDGVDAVFLVWPFAAAEGADALVKVIAGRARRVVYLSSTAVREHEREVERLIEQSGLEWTFLRPHAFAANALRWARQVRSGVVREPYGQAAMSPVDERDIAAVAVRALTGDGHHGAAYLLTGPESLTQACQAELVGQALGRPVRWAEAPPDESRERMIASGWPSDVVDGVLRAQAALVSNPGPTTSTVEHVTGRPARTFGRWALDHADAFRAPAHRTVTRAARIHEYGDASVIRFDELPTPQPGPGEVLIEVAATSFNPSEVGLRLGLLDEILGVRLPHTLGWDVSGTVVAVGAGVTGLAPGDRVIGLVDAAAAGLTVAPAGVLARAPQSIPLADAAAIPVAGLTAWQAVHEHARVGPGMRVLVNGAGGGIGLFAVQLARLAGATVVATASPRSAAAVSRLGAHEVVDYTAAALPGDMDVVLNLAGTGQEEADRLAGLVRPDGVIVSVAAPVTSPQAVHFVMRNDPGQLAELVALVDAGALAVEIAETHPLTALPEIHRRAESGGTRGKIILLPEPALTA